MVQILGYSLDDPTVHLIFVVIAFIASNLLDYSTYLVYCSCTCFFSRIFAEIEPDSFHQYSSQLLFVHHYFTSTVFCIATFSVLCVLLLACALISMASSTDTCLTVPSYEINSYFFYPVTHFFMGSKLNTSPTNIPSMSYDLFKIAESMKRLGSAAALSLFLHSYFRSIFPLLYVPLASLFVFFNAPMIQFLIFKNPDAQYKRPWLTSMYTWRQFTQDIRREVREIQSNGLSRTSSSSSSSKAKKARRPSKYA